MCVSTGSADHCVVSVPGESNSCTRKHVSELLALTKQDVKSCFLKSCLYVLVRRLPGEEHSAVQLNGKSVSIAGATHVFWVDPLCAPSPTFHFAFWSYQETLITLIIQRDILIFLFSSAPAIKTDLFPLGGFLNSAPFRNARCCGHVYAICKMEIYTSLDSLGKIAYQTQAFSPNCQDCCVVTRLLGICLNMIYYSPSNTWNNSTPSSYLFVSCCK